MTPTHRRTQLSESQNSGAKRLSAHHPWSLWLDLMGSTVRPSGMRKSTGCASHLFDGTSALRLLSCTASLTALRALAFVPSSASSIPKRTLLNHPDDLSDLPLHNVFNVCMSTTTVWRFPYSPANASAGNGRRCSARRTRSASARATVVPTDGGRRVFKKP